MSKPLFWDWIWLGKIDEITQFLNDNKLKEFRIISDTDTSFNRGYYLIFKRQKHE
jgi:hypothetical protein